MNPVDALCGRASEYPLNSRPGNKPEYTLNAYHSRLNEHHQRLFSADEKTALNISDLASGGSCNARDPVSVLEADPVWVAFCHQSILSHGRLRSFFALEPQRAKRDPRSRYLFVHADGDSRSKLRASRECLMLAFSYLQVMPEFLEFLFLFGQRTLDPDLYRSGFYQCTRLDEADRGIEDEVRAWSGVEFQLCYALKSVEPSPFQPHWPWSIRHCAVHHTFDVHNIRSTWIMIKGDGEIARRIRSVTGSQGPAEFSSFDSIAKAFTAGMATHLLLCDWSAEHWPSYIGFLEETFRQLTEEATTINADLSTNAFNDTDLLIGSSRSGTFESDKTPKSRTFSWRSAPSQSQHAEKIPLAKMPSRIYTNASGKQQPMPPGKRLPTRQTPNTPTVALDEFGQHRFSFGDLQKVNDIEESINGCVLVLRLNISVVTQLKDYYASLIESEDLPQEIRANCGKAVTRFKRRIDGVVNDFQLQILRAEGLLRLVADRKALLTGLREYQSTVANRQLALQSRKSNKNVEHLTEDMGEIARKTKTETVSMKIITLVTLFFLPGTFISVGGLISLYSTMMSTDVVHWKDGKRSFEPQALKTYVYVTAPFEFAVFVFWAALQLLERSREGKRQQQVKARMAEP